MKVRLIEEAFYAGKITLAHALRHLGVIGDTDANVAASFMRLSVV